MHDLADNFQIDVSAPFPCAAVRRRGEGLGPRGVREHSARGVSQARSSFSARRKAGFPYFYCSFLYLINRDLTKYYSIII